MAMLLGEDRSPTEAGGECMEEPRFHKIKEEAKEAQNSPSRDNSLTSHH